MGQFIDSVNQVQKNYKKYDDWEQKKAGKIGVMQAVNNLDDPRVFADVSGSTN